MSPDDARRYGLIDHVIARRSGGDRGRTGIA